MRSALTPHSTTVEAKSIASSAGRDGRVRRQTSHNTMMSGISTAEIQLPGCARWDAQVRPSTATPRMFADT